MENGKWQIENDSCLDKASKIYEDIIRGNIMDPASLSNLDPKLRETYERVMGTTTPAASDTPPTPPADGTTTTPIVEPAPSTTDTTTPTPSTDTPTPPPVSPDELSTSAAPPAPDSLARAEQPQTVTISQPLPNPATSNVITPPHGHMGLIKVFYVLGGAVFFVIYIFFWLKIFNFNLPF